MKIALASSHRSKVTRSLPSCTAPLCQEMVLALVNNGDANEMSHLLKEMDGRLSLKGQDLRPVPMELRPQERMGT